MGRIVILFSLLLAIILPQNALPQSIGCLSAYGCENDTTNIQDDEIDYLVNWNIDNMEFGGFNIYPPGEERKACEQGCHEAGDNAAGICRNHTNSRDQRLCLEEVMSAVSQCIRHCA